MTELSLIDYTKASEAWGTEKGAEVFARLNKELLNVSQGTIVTLSFRGLDKSDASFQREAIVELIRKYRPRLSFVATDLRDRDVMANLELALDRYQQRLVVRTKSGVRILGRELSQDLAKTLSLVTGLTQATTPTVASKLSLQTATASSRLSTLWKAGLLRRVEAAAASGGREFVYTALL